MSPAASLLICTYDQARELELSLAGVARQRATDFDVWICDDGSGLPTRRVVEAYSATAAVPVHHVWQEHRGFRRASILNAALRQATGRLLIFMDGDCIPHRYFVSDHLASWRPGVYLAGRRVNLGEAISGRLRVTDIQRGVFDRPAARLLWSSLSGGTRHWHRTIRIGPAWLRRLLGRAGTAGIVGSNFSLAREDMLAVNGYDEAFEGYGHEDTELELRLAALGLRSLALRSVALQFHLWHPRRVTAIPNAERMRRASTRSDRVRCARGIRRLSDSDVLDSDGSGVTFAGPERAAEP